MKKDKKWLRDRYESMETIKVTTKNSRGKRSTSYLKKKTVINLLNQLDEPEVLSREWIDEHKKHGRVSNGIFGDSGLFRDYVLVKDLEKEALLVPKQEEAETPVETINLLENALKENKRLGKVIEKKQDEVDQAYKDGYEKGKEYMIEKHRKSKPVIPQFVADWYESEGKHSSWWNWFYKWGRDESRSDLETKTIKWMQDYNEEKFVDMFKRGYKVEEEQKFSVRDKEGVALLGKITELCGRSDYKIGDVVSLQNVDTQDGVSEWGLVLTEEEIKDYDPRYMAFAKPVEELEE